MYPRKYLDKRRSLEAEVDPHYAQGEMAPENKVDSENVWYEGIHNPQTGEIDYVIHEK